MDLRELIAELRTLERTRDPIERDRRAAELAREAPAALRGVRVAAVRQAEDAGISRAEFARRRGLTKQAIDMLLHGRVRTPKAAADPAPWQEGGAS